MSDTDCKALLQSINAKLDTLVSNSNSYKGLITTIRDYFKKLNNMLGVK